MSRSAAVDQSVCFDFASGFDLADAMVFGLLMSVYVLTSHGVFGSFNLYMNESETSRILGYEGDIYYVRDGSPQTFALSLSLPVPADINDIFFVWQSLRKSHEPGLPYNIWFSVSHPEAISHPTTNIKESGEVPTTKSVFRVTLQCMSDATPDVDVSIFLNVSTPPLEDPTSVEIKRTKTCSKLSKEMFGGREGEIKHFHDNFLYRNFSVPETSSQYFYIGVGSVCGSIIVLALVVAACYMRVKRLSYDKQSGMSPINSTAFSERGYLKVDTASSLFENNKSTPKSPVRQGGVGGVMVSYGDLRSADAKTTLQEVGVEASSVSIQELLMEGTYGRIFIGQLIGSCEIIERGDVDRKVLVKSLSADASKAHVEEFLRSGCLMKDLASENLSTLIGACVQDDCRPMLLYAYNGDVNLKKFIINDCSPLSSSHHQPMTKEQLIYMAIQIAHGVHFMHKKHIVHRDLGTRNCLINDQLHVKVTDSALSLDLFPGDYDRLETTTLLPIRWLAPEVILNDTHSPSSDTWAFGVTLWELMTSCSLPYESIGSPNIVTFLEEGYRLSQPTGCPNEVFAIMACCWCMSPEDRPNFVQLQLCLQDYYASILRTV